MGRIKKYDFDTWEPEVNAETLKQCVTDLEDGLVLSFDQLQFLLSDEEKDLFSSELVDENHKNISYDLSKDRLQGCAGDDGMIDTTHKMMKRFAKTSDRFVRAIFPDYYDQLELARTSFRPVEIEGRRSASFRKDDSLLHVDSFPSTPTHGKRILRFFANVNLEEKPRVWKVGEPYQRVLEKFLPKAKRPLPGEQFLLEKLKITKSYRSLYDHYMLQVHNKMKGDSTYQKEVDHEVVQFAPFTCWLVFTDQVSHAALSGQYVFEQSFYLPVEGQKFPEKSPVAIMEKLLGTALLSKEKTCV